MTTTIALPKPAPTPVPRTRAWWDALDEGVLLLQRCRNCGTHQFYPRILCTHCWSDDLDWVPAEGAGRVRTFTVVHMPGHPAWRDEAPFALAIVELDEGVRMMTRIVDADPEDVRVGQRVRLSIRVMSEGEHALPVFVSSR